jgi:hypothetical protein
MNRIFISYRREDSQPYAGRLSDLLTMHLGENVVFMDVDGISPGEDFVQTISEQLSACSVFLPVIGPHWLHVRRGLRRRLFTANDFVRLEILAALKRPIQVIPVLVGGATMPPAGSLPKSIIALAERNAMEVTDNRFRTDVARLADTIKTRVDGSSELAGNELQLECERVTHIIEADIRQTRRRHRVQLAGVGGSLLLVLMIAITLWVASRWSVPAPHFAEANVTPDPTGLRVNHPDDTRTFELLNERGYTRQPQTFSLPRGGTEPVLKLSDSLGSRGPETVAAIEHSGRIVFQAVGSTGNVTQPERTRVVAARMVKDFEGLPGGIGRPSFLFLLGDVIVNFGEAKYYYDQFYSPFRNYPAPIFAIAGNHDGIIELGGAARPLDAFLANFAAEKPFHRSPDALELERTAQIQPGVYFTFEAPFVRILALYSNVSELSGVISSQGGAVPELSDDQLKFLEAAFTRIKNERFQGAVIVAVHHDLFAAGQHSTTSSPGMLLDLDNVSNRTGVWPHVVLSANGHNYQRLTRTVGSSSVVYVVAGTGGANLARLANSQAEIFPRHLADPDVVLNDLAYSNLGYVRMVADRRQLQVDFQSATGDVSTVLDRFKLDLESRRLVP